MHMFVTLMLLLSGFWFTFLINIPLVAYHIRRYVYTSVSRPLYKLPYAIFAGFHYFLRGIARLPFLLKNKQKNIKIKILNIFMWDASV